MDTQLEQEKAKIRELMYQAGIHIYIIAKSDSKNFDDKTVQALKDAWEANVNIYVALYQAGNDLPPVWQEIKKLSEKFKTDVPLAKMIRRNEIIIADDTVRTEHTDNAGNKTIQKEKHSAKIDEIAGEFFDIEPQGLTKAVQEYNHWFHKDLNFYEEALMARIRLDEGGVFPQPGRYEANRLIPTHVFESRHKPQKTQLSSAVTNQRLPIPKQDSHTRDS